MNKYPATVGKVLTGALLFFLFNFNTVNSPVLAYDTNYAHPALTEEVVKLFNGKSSSNEKIKSEEINWLKQGAIEEDEPARWINHFYDPVHHVGWTGKHFGRLTPEDGYKEGADLAPKPALASIDWATNQTYQAAYGRQYGNQTWQKALKSYLDGDKQTAFLALGHVLHLIEDASVPDHTRDDSHTGIYGDPGSPYELYSADFTQYNRSGVASELLNKNTNLYSFLKIQDAFERLANYSNNNFFSEDTINNDDFSLPNMNFLEIRDKDGSNYLYDKNEKIYLAQKNNDVGFVGKDVRKYTVDDGRFVLPSYREHLFPEAVLTGASVLELFFKEVEKYRVHPELMEPIVSDTNAPILATIAQLPVRTIIKLCDSGSFCKTVANAVDGVRINVQSTVASLLDQVKNNVNLTWFSSPPLSNSNATIAPVLPALASPVTEKPKQPFVPLANIIEESTSKTISALAAEQPVVKAPVVPTISPTVPKPPAPNPVVSKSIVFYPASSIADSTPIPAPTAGTAIQNSAPVSVGSASPAPASGDPTVETPVTPVTTSTPTSTPAPIIISLNPPTIDQTSPIYTSSTVALTGTFSSNTIFVSAYESVGDGVYPSTTSVLLSSSTWQFVVNLKPGLNYFYFQASSTNATSTLAGPAEIIFDLDPPRNPMIGLSAVDTNLQISLTSTDQFSPQIFYDVDYRTSTDWQAVAIRSQSSTFTMPSVRGQTYFVRSRAYDALNNVSDWNTSSIYINWSQEVVINEVAWAGTSSLYPYDEWFELYNNTDQPIDLKDWKILVSGKQISYNKINNSVIAPRGYFLLKRSRDDSIYNIPGDVIYSLSGGFGNQGEKLEIFKPTGEKTDEVDCSKGWFAGDNTLYRTMERISTTAAGNIPTNWQSNGGPRPLARTYNGGPIFGSPRQSNFGNIDLNGSQLEITRTLTKENNPYVLEGYIIPAGYTLNIAPGVVVKANYSWSNFNVLGNLIVGEENGEPVTLTSGRDTNFSDPKSAMVVGSWSTTTPSAKDWQGFRFRPSSTGKFYSANIRFAGKEFFMDGYIYTTSVSEAIHAENSDLTIKNSKLSNNGAVALHAENSSVSVSGSKFDSGDRAIEALGSQVVVSDTTFDSFTNATGPLYLKDNWPSLKNISFENNLLDLPYFISVNMNSDSEIKDPVYINNLSVAEGATLNIAPGSSVRLARYSTIEVRGSLKAIGTAEAPITIQGLTASSTWGDINFVSSTSFLINVVMRGGGLLTSFPIGKDGVLLLDSSDLTIDHSVFYDSRPAGNILRSKNSRLYIGNSSFGFTEKPPFQTIAINAAGGEMLLDNLLFTNLTYGIYGNSFPLPTTTFSNINSADFVNVDHPTEPANWIPPENFLL